MRKFLSQRNPISLLSITTFLFLISCSQPESGKKEALPTPSPTNSPSPSATSNSAANQVTSMPDGFSTNNICLLPKEIGGNSPFAKLGGGTWGKWGDSDGELDYGCNGGNDSVKLEQETAKISAGYGALGGANTAHYVSAEYTALQYGGKTPIEKQLRQQYFDFCDNLSEKFYGQKLPERFWKRLSDESRLSVSDKENEYQEKVGTGYVSLAARREKEVMIKLEVRFFASEAEYKKYKDS